MREITLPTTQTFSMPLDLDVLRSTFAGDGRHQGVTLGTMVVNEKVLSEIATARKNGGAILYATTSIEQKMEYMLLDYFMGPFIRFDARREMFGREILKSTALSYSDKKELVVKVITEGELLLGKKKNIVQKHLKSIMEWRNVFAHGKILHDSKMGCILEYYSGHKQKLYLSDKYWNEVETCFKECDALLDEVGRRLENNSPDASGQSELASK
jgi:hypothetical protein